MQALSNRTVRLYLILAALVLFGLHIGQSYLQLKRAREGLRDLGNTLAESSAVAAASPLWLLSERTVEEILRSVAVHEAVHGVLLYEHGSPALLLYENGRLRGSLGTEAERIDASDLEQANTFNVFYEEVVFDQAVIGGVEVYLKDGLLSRRRQDALLRSSLFLLSEIIIIALFMRMRVRQMETVALNRERDLLQGEVRRRENVESKLRRFAFYDELTGLPRPRALGEEVAIPAPATDGSGTRYLLLVSLENLPELSSVFDSHRVDELIRVFADRLRAALDGHDAVALRGRGFRFYVAYTVGSDDTEAGLAERIASLFREPVSVANRDVRLRVRVGIARYGENDGFEETRKRSEIALRSLRARGGTERIGRFDETDQAEADRRVLLESAMSSPSFLTELSVVFQPIVDIGSRRPVGYEALVRWDHPVYGTVSPGEFIPLAEENGLILDVGWHVLHESILFAAKLREHHPGEKRFVSVNVSPVQLFEADLPDRFLREIDAAGLAVSSVKIEITETTIEEGQETFWRAAEAFRKLGLPIAIDDFGSGASAFRRLYDFSFDTLKIDQYFIREMRREQSLPVVRAISQLTEAIGMAAIAEGIETEAQAAFAREGGCSLGQGFLFGRPAPAEAYLQA